MQPKRKGFKIEQRIQALEKTRNTKSKQRETIVRQVR